MSDTPVRQSRRQAATRRKVVVESSDEDEDIPVKQEEDDEEDFTPAPQTAKRSPRKSAAPASRRKVSNPAAAVPRTVGRARKAASAENIDPSEIFEPEQSMAAEPVSPSKRASSPRKAKATPALKRVRASVAAELAPALPPTPQASKSPEPSQVPASPLADITETLNERPRSSDSHSSGGTIKPIRAMDTILERPMDIVLKSRANAMPVQEDTGPKARIVITYLILTNFKSYAGRQEVGPFHASFSSVVGPNGSGKSNVIDSLLFVFGFRASKMRQGKISALIHNSAAFPNLDHCEVAVHFQEVMDLVCAFFLRIRAQLILF